MITHKLTLSVRFVVFFVIAGMAFFHQELRADDRLDRMMDEMNAPRPATRSMPAQVRDVAGATARSVIQGMGNLFSSFSLVQPARADDQDDYDVTLDSSGDSRESWMSTAWNDAKKFASQAADAVRKFPFPHLYQGAPGVVGDYTEALFTEQIEPEFFPPN